MSRRREALAAARELASRGEYREAVSALWPALAVDPTDPNCADLLDQIGLMKGVELVALGLFDGARAAEEAGDLTTALHLLEKSIEWDPTNDHVQQHYQVLGDDVAKKKTQEAFGPDRVSSRDAETTPGLLLARGEELLEKGDAEGAVDCFERLLRIEPDNERAYELSFLARARLAQTREIDELYERAQEAASRQRYGEAVEILRDLLYRAPHHVQAEDMLAELEPLVARQVEITRVLDEPSVERDHRAAAEDSDAFAGLEEEVAAAPPPPRPPRHRAVDRVLKDLSHNRSEEAVDLDLATTGGVTPPPLEIESASASLEPESDPAGPSSGSGGFVFDLSGESADAEPVLLADREDQAREDAGLVVFSGSLASAAEQFDYDGGRDRDPDNMVTLSAIQQMTARKEQILRDQGGLGRSGRPTPDQARHEPPPGRGLELTASRLVGVSVAVILLAGALWFALAGQTSLPYREALAAVEEGRIDEAVKLVEDYSRRAEIVLDRPEVPAGSDRWKAWIVANWVQGRARLAAGDIDAAVAALERVSGALPASSLVGDQRFDGLPAAFEVWLTLGRALVAQGDEEGALRALSEAVRVDPAAVDALIALANLEWSMGRKESAISRLRRAVESGDFSAEATALLVDRLDALGKTDEAADIAGKVADRNRYRAPEAAVQRIQVLRHQGRLEEALDLVEDTFLWAPDSVDLALERARVLDALGRDAAARQALEDVLVLDPANRTARLALAQRHVAAGRLDDALALLEPVLRGETPPAEAYLLKGRILARQKRWADAAGAFEAGLAIDGGAAGAWEELGRVYERMHDVERAVHAYKRAVELDGNRRRARQRLERLGS